MAAGKHYLIVTNLMDAPQSTILAQAKALGAHGQHRLSILTVLEAIPALYYQIPTTVQLQRHMHKQAKHEQAELAARLDIPRDQCFLRTGGLHHKITEFVKEHGVDTVLDYRRPFAAAKTNPLKQWWDWACHQFA